jgi:hypothetical protein
LQQISAEIGYDGIVGELARHLERERVRGETARPL